MVVVVQGVRHQHRTMATQARLVEIVHSEVLLLRRVVLVVVVDQRQQERQEQEEQQQRHHLRMDLMLHQQRVGQQVRQHQALL
jgi:hypothetical protein